MANQELSCDAVIVGGGLAGLTAGIRLRELGRDPIVLEAQEDELYANNTRWGGGVFHLAFRSVMAPAAELERRTIDMSKGFVAGDLAHIMAEDCERATHWLQGHGVEFVSMDPDEGWRDFVDYVKEYGIARSEGLLLRYLSQVHGTLVRNVPDAHKTDALYDAIAYLRTLLADVDVELLQLFAIAHYLIFVYC